MTTAQAFWEFLPAGLDELFEMVDFKKTDASYNIWLDEKKPVRKKTNATTISWPEAIRITL